MAIKKSELYSKIWDGCNVLRGSMDASQYKDYVLSLLFIKYISDKWYGKPFSPIVIPEGASFKDMLEFRGKSDIGDLINKRIIAPLIENNRITSMPDFNDTDKLGSGKEQVDRLTKLINVFNKKELDFSNNRADGDDILGDAYEYLMRHFATESGKSKGQFYTPSEVSRIMAQVIGINKAHSRSETTVYDPTCGSGSLLLKVGAEANADISLYGQEMDLATSGLAQMNMILHGNPSAEIKKGNTLANPWFKENGNLKQFDYVVANPPFSDKRWTTGLTLPQDAPYNRFSDYGIPPAKNGDYAFMLHIVRSLKQFGKGAVILPHGVLFRGNAEQEIRTNLIKKGYIKAIIGLPANLFYGTGIPATIIIIDKENAQSRKGIFMIDAGKGFIKDGNKNRLREQDIKKITETFDNFIEMNGYSRMVSVTEIEQNEYNLNIPRYIDSIDTEDIQDIEAHLLGDIPTVDIDNLSEYWKVYPTLKSSLFDASMRSKYSMLKVGKDAIKDTIFTHHEFVKFQNEMDKIFDKWKGESTVKLKAIDVGSKPKEIISELADRLLTSYNKRDLIDKYDIYQYLMIYWNETMQDDCYIISMDGWVANTRRIIEVNKKKKEVDKGWACDLIPKDLVISCYFADEQNAINALEEEKETIEMQLAEMEEEYSREDGCFSDLDKVNKGNINARLKELKTEEDSDKEIEIFTSYLSLMDNLAKAKKSIKTATAELDALLYAKYPTLTPDEVKTLVVDDKWMATIENDISNEIDQISQKLSNRIKELADRYENTLPELDAKVEALEEKVDDHLKKMGFTF